MRLLVTLRAFNHPGVPREEARPSTVRERARAESDGRERGGQQPRDAAHPEARHADRRHDGARRPGSRSARSRAPRSSTPRGWRSTSPAPSRQARHPEHPSGTTTRLLQYLCPRPQPYDTLLRRGDHHARPPEERPLSAPYFKADQGVMVRKGLRADAEVDRRPQEAQAVRRGGHHGRRLHPDARSSRRRRLPEADGGHVPGAGARSSVTPPCTTPRSSPPSRKAKPRTYGPIVGRIVTHEQYGAVFEKGSKLRAPVNTGSSGLTRTARSASCRKSGQPRLLEAARHQVAAQVGDACTRSSTVLLAPRLPDALPDVWPGLPINLQMMFIAETLVLFLRWRSPSYAVFRGAQRRRCAPWRSSTPTLPRHAADHRGARRRLRLAVGLSSAASRPEPVTYGIIALTLVYSAYVAEVYRAGIESVHPSQRWPRARSG